MINYLATPIILSFSGARACAELCWYKDARNWLHMGLTVSFNKCFKRDTRCNATNISRIINTFQANSSTHNASDVLLYCTEQFKEAEILLRSSLDYSTKICLKEETILNYSQSFCWIPLIFLWRQIITTNEPKLINALQSQSTLLINLKSNLFKKPTLELSFQFESFIQYSHYF